MCVDVVHVCLILVFVSLQRQVTMHRPLYVSTNTHK